MSRRETGGPGIWLRCSGMDSHHLEKELLGTSGKAGSHFLAKLWRRSRPVCIWVMGNKKESAHSFLHGWTLQTDASMVMILQRRKTPEPWVNEVIRKWMSLPVSVVDDGVDDGVHLLGEFGGVRGELLCGRAAASLFGLRAAVVSARGVFVLSSFAFAFLQSDLLLHLFQVSVLNGLEARKKREKKAANAGFNISCTNYPQMMWTCTDCRQ